MVRKLNDFTKRLFDNDVFFSNRLTEKKFQSLLDEPSVDVWKVDAEGRLDIRMSRQLYESLGWEECSVLHESVEELVLNFEKQLLNQSRADAADWFEEYVSIDNRIYKSRASLENIY